MPSPPADAGRPLDRRTALVTGGGRGLGRAIALALAGAGSGVAVLARTGDEVRRVAEEITAAGGQAAPVVADVADGSALVRAVAEVEAALGPVDVLVANAGVVWPLGPLVTVDPDRWAAAVGINLVGAFRCIRAVLPGMLDRGWGRIVTVSSGAAGGTGMPSAGAYSASKAGLELLTVNLAAELAGTGITANAVRPGTVDTAMQDYIRAQERDVVGARLHDRFHALHREGRLTDPAEPARFVVELVAGDRTGEVLDVRDPR